MAPGLVSTGFPPSWREDHGQYADGSGGDVDRGSGHGDMGLKEGERNDRAAGARSSDEVRVEPFEHIFSRNVGSRWPCGHASILQSRDAFKSYKFSVIDVSLPLSS